MEIICHMMTSVDGRKIAERWTPVCADMPKVYAEAAEKLEAQGFMVGSNTMARMFADLVEVREPVEGPKTFHVTTHKGEVEGHRLAVVLDPLGTLHYKSATLPTGEHIVAVLGSHVTRAYQQELEAVGVSYIVRTPGTLAEETRDVLKHLEKEFGVTKILLQGGGKTVGSFMHMKLVNKLSVMVAPAVDGLAGVPSFINYDDSASDLPMEGLKLELTDVEKVEGGIVWLRYDVKA